MPHASLQLPSTETPTTDGHRPTLPPAAVAALWRGQVIDAVTLVRMEQQVDVEEANSSIEAYLQTQPVLKRRIEHAQADAREGLFRWTLFLVIGGLGLACVLM